MFVVHDTSVKPAQKVWTTNLSDVRSLLAKINNDEGRSFCDLANTIADMKPGSIIKVGPFGIVEKM